MRLGEDCAGHVGYMDPQLPAVCRLLKGQRIVHVLRGGVIDRQGAQAREVLAQLPLERWKRFEAARQLALARLAHGLVVMPGWDSVSDKGKVRVLVKVPHLEQKLKSLPLHVCVLCD